MSSHKKTPPGGHPGGAWSFSSVEQPWISFLGVLGLEAAEARLEGRADHLQELPGRQEPRQEVQAGLGDHLGLQEPEAARQEHQGHLGW